MNDYEFQLLLNKLHEYLATEKTFVENSIRMTEIKNAAEVAHELFPKAKIYIKDDDEMARYLLDIALKDAALYQSEEDFNAGISIRGTELEKLITDFEHSKATIDRLCQVIDRAALLAISSGVSVNLDDEQ